MNESSYPRSVGFLQESLTFVQEVGAAVMEMATHGGAITQIPEDAITPQVEAAAMMIVATHVASGRSLEELEAIWPTVNEKNSTAWHGFLNAAAGA